MTQSKRLSLPFDQGLLSLPDSGQIVLWNAEPSQFLRDIPAEQLVCVQGFRETYGRLIAANHRVEKIFDGPAQMAIVQLNRSKVETLGMVGAAYAQLEDGGILVVDGDKTLGIESVFKAVKSLVPVDGSLTKAHGRIFWATKSSATPNEMSAWTDALHPSKNTDGFTTAPGCFSSDGIDPASNLLAEHLPKLSGKGVDLGAGWGWLSYTALSANPDITDMQLVEADTIALDCAKLNITDARATFEWMDAAKVPETHMAKFVLMNPPFHVGRKPDMTLGQAFIRKAAGLLHPSGRLYMVANRQLAYEAVLDACFHHVETIVAPPRFKVIFARKPKR